MKFVPRIETTPDVYTKRDFGHELEVQLLREVDVLALSHWAYRVYLDNVHDLEPGVEEAIMAVVVMEEGPEFRLSRDELRGMAEAWQADVGPE
jgi:hypothetical protein